MSPTNHVHCHQAPLVAKLSKKRRIMYEKLAKDPAALAELKAKADASAKLVEEFQHAKQ